MFGSNYFGQGYFGDGYAGGELGLPIDEPNSVVVTGGRDKVLVAAGRDQTLTSSGGAKVTY